MAVIKHPRFERELKARKHPEEILTAPAEFLWSLESEERRTGQPPQGYIPEARIIGVDGLDFEHWARVLKQACESREWANIVAYFGHRYEREMTPDFEIWFDQARPFVPGDEIATPGGRGRPKDPSASRRKEVVRRVVKAARELNDDDSLQNVCRALDNAEVELPRPWGKAYLFQVTTWEGVLESLSGKKQKVSREQLVRPLKRDFYPTRKREGLC